jgi:hypothetical protein
MAVPRVTTDCDALVPEGGAIVNGTRWNFNSVAACQTVAGVRL